MEHWHSCHFPSSEATDDLASAVAKAGAIYEFICCCFHCLFCSMVQAKKKGIDRPFLYWLVTKFAPLWCVPNQIEVDDKEKGKAKTNKRLDMIQWSAAYQCFALACACTGMWEYHFAMAHYTNCLKVACKSLLHCLHCSVVISSVLRPSPHMECAAPASTGL